MEKWTLDPRLIQVRPCIHPGMMYIDCVTCQWKSGSSRYWMRDVIQASRGYARIYNPRFISLYIITCNKIT
jgi:hypothetical protein